MATRRVIKAVLHNFLGTFMSRYSDYQGYWLLGFLVLRSERLDFDLLTLETDSSDDAAITAAKTIACARFGDQLAKAALDPSYIREARLDIERLPDAVDMEVNGHIRSGNQMRFTARAMSDLGRTYRCEKAILVAPHNPRFEWRSARAT